MGDRDVKRWAGFDRSNIVEFRSKFYFCSTSAARDSFLREPLKYLYNQLLPTEFARAVRLGSLLNLQYSSQPELEGFCPVALSLTGALVRGSAGCLVEFRGKIYACADDKAKSMFMAAPARWCHVTKLPVKRPPSVSRVTTKDLLNKMREADNITDALVFLEQSLSDAVHDALLSLSSKRLKYPCLTVRETSLKFIGLFLRSRNPRRSDVERSERTQKLEQFVEECQLIDVINKNKVGGSGASIAKGLRMSPRNYKRSVREFDVLNAKDRNFVYDRFVGL